MQQLADQLAVCKGRDAPLAVFILNGKNELAVFLEIGWPADFNDVSSLFQMGLVTGADKVKLVDAG